MPKVASLSNGKRMSESWVESKDRYETFVPKAKKY